jgi:hypothetical protein
VPGPGVGVQPVVHGAGAQFVVHGGGVVSRVVTVE